MMRCGSHLVKMEYQVELADVLERTVERLYEYLFFKKLTSRSL
jgi:hypothetical protein